MKKLLFLISGLFFAGPVLATTIIPFDATSTDLVLGYIKQVVGDLMPLIVIILGITIALFFFNSLVNRNR